MRFFKIKVHFVKNVIGYRQNITGMAMHAELEAEMDYFEKRIDGETKYEGVIVNVYLDRAELVNGKIVKREVVDHPGGVGILPVDEDLNCYMVKQYRYPVQCEMLEIPAGKLERGEYHGDCAVRELEEETGFTADSMEYFGKTVLSPGYSTEALHIYIATGLHAGKSHPDENEFLNVYKYPLKELVEMVADGEISDAKSIIAILAAARKML